MSAAAMDVVFGENVDTGGDLRKFITNEDYVTEEHHRQLKHGILPYVFGKHEFTASEQEEFNSRKS